MSEEEKQIEQPDRILKIVQEILIFNKKKIQNERVLGLEILTPDQMLSRLPITLAQLNAENNSEKLENEVRQLLYSLYRSKNLTKMFIKVWLILCVFKNTISKATYKNRNNLYEH